MPLICTSPAVQWLRIRLPMQGTGVRFLVREDPTCCRATKLVGQNYWARCLEPASCNCWACTLHLLILHATTTEAQAPRAWTLQQERPQQWEACAPQRRVAPLTASRESPRAATKTQRSQKKKNTKMPLILNQKTNIDKYYEPIAAQRNKLHGHQYR